MEKRRNYSTSQINSIRQQLYRLYLSRGITLWEIARATGTVASAVSRFLDGNVVPFERTLFRYEEFIRRMRHVRKVR